MVKKRYKKQQDEVLTLEDLQALRDTAKGFELKKAITQIDLHFMPPKPKRQKKEKKKRIFRDRN
jgi:hypothetical protein